jgi:hypothetical protein
MGAGVNPEELKHAIYLAGVQVDSARELSRYLESLSFDVRRAHAEGWQTTNDVLNAAKTKADRAHREAKTTLRALKGLDQ